MTEQEWLAGTDLAPLAFYVGDEAGPPEREVPVIVNSNMSICRGVRSMPCVEWMWLRSHTHRLTKSLYSGSRLAAGMSSR
jgi:hypothetical protein